MVWTRLKAVLGKTLEDAVVRRVLLAIQPTRCLAATSGERRSVLQAELEKKVFSLLDVLSTQGEEGLSRTLGWSLKIAPSTINSGGSGAFVAAQHVSSAKTAVAAGDLIALYPGVLMTAQECVRANIEKKDVNEYLITRFDYKGVSAAPWARTDEVLGVRLHSMARGHLIQHPPLGVTPNCAFVDFDYKNVPQHWRTLIPNVRPGRAGTADVVHGAVIVAISPVQVGDELFMDYRYNPQDAPSWWHPCPEWLNVADQTLSGERIEESHGPSWNIPWPAL